nr:hypothetical protein CFP56_17625 [Quercus suber]
MNREDVITAKGLMGKRKKEETGESHGNKKDRGPVSGGSYKSLKKTYYQQINSVHIKHSPPKHRQSKNDDIMFSERDANGIKQPHDDPLVITLGIEGFTTKRVLVDNESSTDIMYSLSTAEGGS